MLILKVHPVVEFSAIILVFYAAWLGFKRMQSLHFGKATHFRRDLHAIIGSISIVTILCGVAAAKIIVSRFTDSGIAITTGIHGRIALISTPFLFFAIFSGFYLYLNPGRRKFLPLLHAVNNLIVIGFCLFQIYSGSVVMKTLPAG